VITSHSTGDSYQEFRSNASAPSLPNTDYGIYVVSGEFLLYENGSEEVILTEEDSATLTGSTWDFSAVTNFEIPNSDSITVDSNGELAIDNNDDQFLFYINGTAYSFDFTADSADYVLVSDGSGAFTMQAQAGGGGDTSWDDLNDPDAGQPAAFTMNGAGETTTFTMSADNTEWLFDFTAAYTTSASPDLFKIIQQTGSPQAVTLLTLQASDSNVTVLEAGNGASNATIISQAGLMSFTGAGGVIPVPGSADGGAIGSAAKEYSDLYLAASGVIYGENDQGNTLTSSATGWTANLGVTATTMTSSYTIVTPQSITYDTSSDEDQAIGTDITSSVVLVTGDNDGTDEEIDLQDGTVAGQILTFITVDLVDDADDAFIVDVATDSTCSGCPDSGSFTLETIGSKLTLYWTGSAWIFVGQTTGA
jgi:hypothetical protein